MVSSIVEVVINLITEFANELFGNPNVQAHNKWIILGVVFIFIELIHRSWMIIWFTLGALAAMIIAFFLPDENLMQIGAFFLTTVVSLGIFLVVRPKPPVPDDPHIRKGRKVICVKTLDNDIHGVGAVKIDGIEYRAKLTKGSEPVKESQWLILEGWDDKDNLIVSVRPMVEEKATEEV